MARMQGLMESCYAKTVMSGVMGFGLGGLFGAFMASVRCSLHSLDRVSEPSRANQAHRPPVLPRKL